jgi:hypothetical protein
MRAPPLSIALLPCVAWLAACGGAHDATEKQISDLRSEVVKLRADNAALAERLDGVELRGTRPRATPGPAPAAEVATREQPQLDVVRLAPEGGAAADDADAEGPRPVLRGSGKTGSIDEAGARPASSAAPPKPRAVR